MVSEVSDHTHYCHLLMPLKECFPFITQAGYFSFVGRLFLGKVLDL